MTHIKYSHSPVWRRRHLIRMFCFIIIVSAVLLVKLPVHMVWALPASSAIGSSVLGAATGITSADLLADTNKAREDNNLPPLTLNPKLTASAQAKANDMVAKDYWDHVSPDGIQPWYFFEQADYLYQTAGENLAYGFTSPAAIIKAWLDSPTHRANLLGSYKEIGFGMVEARSFQGGPNTVIVAHFGTVLQRNGGSVSTTNPATTSGDGVASSASTSRVPVGANTPAVATSESQDIAAWQAALLGAAPLTVVTGLCLLMIAVGVLYVTHRHALWYSVHEGHRFIITHPIVDVVLVAAAIALILTTAVAKI